MSVIGPRPALWNQDVLTAERDKYGANDVKPGLTGWAQINGRDELEIPVKAKLDGEYVQKESLLFDIKCFLVLLGQQLNPYPYLKMCDIYFQPSRHEGYGIAVAVSPVGADPWEVSQTLYERKGALEHGRTEKDGAAKVSRDGSRARFNTGKNEVNTYPQHGGVSAENRNRRIYHSDRP